jgi:hypothetical protein
VNTLLIEDANSFIRSPRKQGSVARTRGLNHDTSYMSLGNDELIQNTELMNITEPTDAGVS